MQAEGTDPALRAPLRLERRRPRSAWWRIGWAGLVAAISIAATSAAFLVHGGEITSWVVGVAADAKVKSAMTAHEHSEDAVHEQFDKRLDATNSSLDGLRASVERLATGVDQLNSNLWRLMNEPKKGH